MSSSPRPFDHLVFDLDDTLLDTSRQLLPRASREAFSSMIVAGLRATLEDCAKAWDDHRNQQLRNDIFPCLVKRFGVREGADADAVAYAGFHAFYHRKVETSITLFPGVREMLEKLHAGYRLHLVTSGSRETQEEKISILKLNGFFENIHHVDPNRGERKRDAFSRIMNLTGGAPERHLTIGNRVDTDIGEARELGWRGCWVRYGEHANMLPSTPLEEPDFVIERTIELIEKCRL